MWYARASKSRLPAMMHQEVEHGDVVVGVMKEQRRDL